MSGLILQKNISRYVTGNNIPSVGIFPLPVAQPGTFSSQGIYVAGTGVLFNQAGNLFLPGAYLYSQTLKQAVRIYTITSAYHLILDQPFNANVTGDPCYVIRLTGASIIAESTGSSPSVLQGVPFVAGVVEAYNAFKNPILPLVYSASGSNQQITFVEGV